MNASEAKATCNVCEPSGLVVALMVAARPPTTSGWPPTQRNATRAVSLVDHLQRHEPGELVDLVVARIHQRRRAHAGALRGRDLFIQLSNVLRDAIDLSDRGVPLLHDRLALIRQHLREAVESAARARQRR